MDIFNYIGLIIVVIIMIPNIVFGIKNRNGFANSYHNKFVELFEQIGRYSCFCLMIINIPYTYFGFFLANGKIIYVIIDSVLVTIYLLGWIFCFNKHLIFRSYLLSIIPSLMFIFSGIMICNIPLIIMSIVFSCSHITISLKNAYKYTR